MKNEFDSRATLMELDKDQLVELIGIHARDFLALDGVWFQSIEQAEGMEQAMFHDIRAWERYTEIEAKRIKKFLGLDDHPGLEGLEQALRFRLSANVNEHEVEYIDGKLVYTMRKCRIQHAREAKGMPFHPCKRVGVVEYAGFARAIDERIRCTCLSCYPDVTDPTCNCKWEFELEGAGSE